jgi:ABC-type tungstate transport system substrate-binding protein
LSEGTQNAEIENELFSKGFGIGCISVPAILLPTLIIWAIFDSSFSFSGVLIIGFVILTFSAIGTLFIGIPVYLLFRKLGITHWSAYTFTGFLFTGAAVGSSFNGLDLIVAIAGPLEATIFWWFAVRPIRATTAKQNAGLQEPGAS